jgi:iron complex outermembrane receptor protein
MEHACRRLFVAFLLATTADGALAQAVPSGAPENIGTVEGSAVGTGAAAAVPATAAQFAPSRPSLEQQQPTSTIGAEQLQKFTIPTEDYNDIVALSPSAMDVSPAGPGLQQDFAQSIRGLQYTEFSVLIDGLQLQPSPGNLSPQPAVYFMEHDLGSVTVNRGPGLASDIGSATFGGFVSIKSAPLSADAYVEPYGTFGSFGTKLFGVELSSGDIAQLNGARVDLDLSREEARGADTGLETERRNLYFKYQQPIGRSTLVTTYVNLDNDDTDTPYGTSLKNIVAYGPNYSLNEDPTSQDYAGYNRDNYTSDIEYLRVKSDLGRGYGVEGTIYTQGYYHRGTETADPGGSTPNLIDKTIYINNVATPVTDDVQGTADHNDQRDWGALLRFTKDTSIGQGRVQRGLHAGYGRLHDQARGHPVHLRSVQYADDRAALRRVRAASGQAAVGDAGRQIRRGDAVAAGAAGPDQPAAGGGLPRRVQPGAAGVQRELQDPGRSVGLRAGGERLSDAAAERVLHDERDRD